jgi:hypothetical protein
MKASDLLLILAFALFAILVRRWGRLWRTIRFPGHSGWPLLPATVEQTILHSYSGSGGTTYRVEICYSYRVNSEYYSGRSMGDGFFSGSEADDLTSQYPKGVVIQVHVHPSRPELSVWDP